MPGSSHALDLKSTRLVDSGCGMQLRLALLDEMGVRKVVAWVQSCTGSKVHEASWFFVWGAAAACTIGRTRCPRAPEHVWFALGAIVAQGIGLSSGLRANHTCFLLFVVFFPTQPPFFTLWKSGESEEWDLLLLSGFAACATLNMN